MKPTHPATPSDERPGDARLAPEPGFEAAAEARADDDGWPPRNEASRHDFS